MDIIRFLREAWSDFRIMQKYAGLGFALSGVLMPYVHDLIGLTVCPIVGHRWRVKFSGSYCKRCSIMKEEDW